MISIIIPVYNVEKYLPECLDSILAQSYPHWEAILIDDGSQDASGDICDSYAKIDNRFRVIHQKNGGAACAKNTGLDAVRGEYIAFLDSDDTVSPNWLARTLEAMGNADVTEYNFDRHCPQGYQPEETLGVATFGPEEYLEQYLDHWQCSLFWNKLFRAELLEGIRFRKERRCIDDEFFTYKAVAGANKIVRIHDVLYHYRKRKSSAVINPKNALQKTKDSIDIRRERFEWIGSRFPGLRRKYLQKDVEILYYFAQEFLFDEEAAKNFRALSRYYLRQCLICRPGILTLRLSLGLLRYSKKNLTAKKLIHEKISQEECFD